MKIIYESGALIMHTGDTALLLLYAAAAYRQSRLLAHERKVVNRLCKDLRMASYTQ